MLIMEHFYPKAIVDIIIILQAFGILSRHRSTLSYVQCTCMYGNKGTHSEMFHKFLYRSRGTETLYFTPPL